MEQTKNEPKNENKAAPDNGKPKNLTPGREPSSLLEWPRREGGRQSQGAQAADRSPKAETSENDSAARYGAGIHRCYVADIRPIFRQGAATGNGRLQHRNARRRQGEPSDHRRQGESIRTGGDGGTAGEPQPRHAGTGRYVRPRGGGNGQRQGLRPC